MKFEKELEKVIKRAVKDSIKNCSEIALALSGGLDSSIIAKILKDSNKQFKCYSVSFGKENLDMKIAEKLAKDLKLDFDKILIKESYEKLIKRVMRITNKKDPITIGVGMPIAVIAERLKKEKKDLLISGLGSDEIFAGYNSHSKALEKGLEEVQKECKRRINEEVKKDIKRDKEICEKYGINVALPFLDKRVIKLGLEIPPKLKISKDKKKIILRKIAKKINLPEYVYNRPKKAAQYGTGSNKIIKKISKKRGFKKTKDYLNKIYKQIYKKPKHCE